MLGIIGVLALDPVKLALKLEAELVAATIAMVFQLNYESVLHIHVKVWYMIAIQVNSFVTLLKNIVGLLFTVLDTAGNLYIMRGCIPDNLYSD